MNQLSPLIWWYVLFTAPQYRSSSGTSSSCDSIHFWEYVGSLKTFQVQLSGWSGYREILGWWDSNRIKTRIPAPESPTYKHGPDSRRETHQVCRRIVCDFCSTARTCCGCNSWWEFSTRLPPGSRRHTPALRVRQFPSFPPEIADTYDNAHICPLEFFPGNGWTFRRSWRRFRM